MAFARDLFTAAGTDPEDFTITFEYLQQAHVKVFVNGTEQTLDTDYAFNSTTVIRFSSATSVLTAGDTVVIERNTSQDTPLVTWSVPGILSQEDLTENTKQSVFMAQEAIDKAALALGLDTDDQWTAQSKRIKDVLDPTGAQDAATKAYVDAAELGDGITSPSTPSEDNFLLRATAGQYIAAPLDTVTDNLTGLQKSNIRADLSLIVGGNVQAHDPILDDLSGLTQAANKVPYFNAPTTAALLDFLDEDDLSSDSATALASQQSIKAYVDATAGDWTEATLNTTTGGTTLTFSSIPSGVTEIEIFWNGVSLTGTDELQIQLGDSGGLETSGYTGRIAQGGVAGVAFSVGFTSTVAQAAASVIYGMATLKKITGNTWFMTLSAPAFNSNRVNAASGEKTLSAELDRVALLSTGSDTFDVNGGVLVRYK